MLRSYLIIAYRNLKHNKKYTLINIFGLAIGLTAALYLFQYVKFEKSYDNFHENADNIYRLIQKLTISGIPESPDHFSLALFGPTLKRELPEVVDYARLWKYYKNDFVISYLPSDEAERIEFLENKVYYADSSFMTMFSFPLITGNASSLKDPNTLLISESMATRIFGYDWLQEEPVGKSLIINGDEEFMITGVFRDIPENSHIKFEILLSLQTLSKIMDLNTAVQLNFRTYLLLTPEVDIHSLESKIRDVLFNATGDFLSRNQYKIEAEFQLQPLRDVHLHSFGFQNEPEVRGSNDTVQFLFITGWFILILAWINYINLSTAWAVKRAREVGIRKVIGAGKQQLILQFLMETFLINCMSIILAITLYQLFYPYFASMANKTIPMQNLLSQPWFLAIIFLILLLGTLLSGGYSAFYLSSLNPVQIMKGRYYSSIRGLILRKTLIVLQFIISISIITGTYCVYKQLSYMKNYDKGYNLSHKLIVHAPYITGDNYHNQYQGFRDAVEEIPDVKRFTASFFSPGDPGQTGIQHIHKKGQPAKKLFVSLNCVAENFFDVYRIQFLHGRGFRSNAPADNETAVISRSLARQLGFEKAEDALLSKIIIAPVWWKKEVTVIGIIDDIIFNSLKDETRSMMFLPAVPGQKHMGFSGSLKLNHYTVEIRNTYNVRTTISRLEQFYKNNFPGNPFEYYFLDEQFNALYKTEEQYGQIMSTASGLSILIACLGLFGLSSFLIKQRINEICIRKVLGAPTKSILLSLAGNYIRLTILSGILAFPVSYILLGKWLDNYAHRIDLQWQLFFFPILIVVMVTLLTISYQSLKAATTNPAVALHTD